MGAIPLFSLAFPLAPSPCPSRSTQVGKQPCPIVWRSAVYTYVYVYVYVYVHLVGSALGRTKQERGHRSAPLTFSDRRWSAILTYYHSKRPAACTI